MDRLGLLETRSVGLRDAHSIDLEGESHVPPAQLIVRRRQRNARPPQCSATVDAFTWNLSADGPQRRALLILSDDLQWGRSGQKRSSHPLTSERSVALASAVRLAYVLVSPCGLPNLWPQHQRMHVR
jgi:hypothetical protein